MTAQKNIVKFFEIDKEDVNLVGGKGANLGEMSKAGFPVPGGFIVTAFAYELFLKTNDLVPKIHKILDHLDVSNPLALADASKSIKNLIISSKIPTELSGEMMQHYLELNKEIQSSHSKFSKILQRFKHGLPPVAIRSSATSEDSKTASFAGQNETFLNIKGEANMVDAVRRCWASLFEARSIFYREQQKLDHFDSKIAVVVQLMVPSEISGIMFSIDPVTNNKTRVVIETVWGLGEYIVQGKVTPDHYEVNKSDLMIVDKIVSPQKIMLSRKSEGETKEIKVPERKILQSKLTDLQIKELAKIAIGLEKHYFFPQDSEFAVAGDKIFIVQTRPITTTAQPSAGKINVEVAQKEEASKKILASGAPASPGIACGPVKILKSAKEIDKILPGDVLVAPQTNPDFVPAMKKACAIVTDKGGRTSHAAIVSRELGIPAVVGTEDATKVLKNNQVITVDGSEGKIFMGGLSKAAIYTKENPAPEPLEVKIRKTATKVYVNLAEPDKAKEIAAKNCDGVGLLRAEFMLAGIGIHPKKAIADRKQKVFIDGLTTQLTTFAQAFYPRPVIYRATDFKTNEYRSLKGGELYEPDEENPMIGFRGAYRYLVQPDVFAMELEAIKNVREKEDFSNLWLMIPFCRTVSELVEVKEMVNKAGLHRGEDFKLLMMCEIPSNVILLDKFIEVGIDGVSVGSNDLTMLTLGVDRDNENVASEYNERDESMLWSFEKIIKTCKKYNVSCSICGQAPSDYPDLTEKLVEWGITSVSVNPDVIDHTRQVVYQAEKKLITKH